MWPLKKYIKTSNSERDTILDVMKLCEQGMMDSLHASIITLQKRVAALEKTVAILTVENRNQG